MEPLTIPNPEKFSKTLGLTYKGSNINGKIWIFVEEVANFEVEDGSKQLLHGRFTCPRLPTPIEISIVYAKCTRGERLALWDKMRRDITQMSDGRPWTKGLGSLEGTSTPSSPLATGWEAIPIDRWRWLTSSRPSRIVDCWTRALMARIIPGLKMASWLRMDRVLVSEMSTQLLDAIRVTNLPRVASDHGPILVRCRMLNNDGSGRAFRFQNMCVRHEGFADLVRRDWMATTEAAGLLNLKIKLASIKQTFKRWNKEVFGNIHANLKACEENIFVAQSEFEEDPSARNRMEINKQMAEYNLLLKMEEDFWLSVGWKRINANGRELTDDLEIKDSTVKFFQNLLAPTCPELAAPDLDLLQQLPFSEQLDDLPKPPDADEVKRAVFDISSNSAPGPDGFSALFYQACWGIAGQM
ncbi:uncharacterized protein LOC121749493 [Salvia splendens]|uniref:uncharacterized protein LOC121749489 n=1 Tax=Salvia splendens TaxID=180675 RepID=UPI001C267F20|nr:uncharacterized protein LOC121749489 [Salvia splendens]XP_041999995.1 uncharacterized protein LOC121749493 [Salvia splendens]